MRMTFLAACAVAALAATDARADFQRWSVEVEEDPFDNKGRLVMMNMDSIASALLIICEQGSNEMIVRWASPFPYDQSSPPEPIASFALAFDTGQRHDSMAATGLLGTGKVGFDAPYSGDDARQILTSLGSAKSKIYLKINNNEPQQFTARGSTKASQSALDYCFTDPPA